MTPLATRLKVNLKRMQTKDLIFYRDVPEASLLRLRAGEAAVYFPVDAHMPCLLVDKPAIVRKTVVKVPVL